LPGEAPRLGAAYVRERATELGVRPTKHLGQNFVIDPNTVERVVRTARVTKRDVVLEVGPGLGSLTAALLPAVAQVIAVEVDPVLAGALPETIEAVASEHAAQLTVVCADAMQVTELPAAPSAMVANLPYNVSVPVLLHLLAAFPSIDRLCVMVQREVGERLAATPGSKAYGVPSVKAQWFCEITVAGAVSRRVFWPEPNVDSVLVAGTRREPPIAPEWRSAVFAVVDAAFGQRRKMLRGALAGAFGTPAEIEAALVSIGVAVTARGEELSVAQFAQLTQALGDSGARSTLPS
jgi:16S rRNA (adenine1518-N6/adenine1519-N6)-dimethyltransferase